ncbi:MAG: HDOD domain-containing protein [bacterium]
MIPLALLQSDIERLFPLPVSLPKLACALADPMGNLRQIVYIIQYDTALTANVIRMANSAAFAPVNPILTVNDAVMRLGTGRILELAMGNQVKGILTASCPGYELTEKELWRHSVAAALGADLLTRFASKQIPPVAFTAALLHDIGKLIISRQIKREWRLQIADLVEAKGVPFIEAERMILGVTHAEVGGAVAKRWSFPKVLADCIALHHEPDSEGNSSVALDAVHIGNVVAKTLAVGMGSEQMNMVACASAARRLGLTPEKFEALCANVLEDLPKIESLFEGV